MKKYHQLTKEERLEIERLWRLGCSRSSIALKLGRNRSTIGREIGRNSRLKYGYSAASATAMTAERRPGREPRLLKNRAAWEAVMAGLLKGWSPEQIAGRMKREDNPNYVCCETIYSYIYSAEGKRLKLWKHLHYRQKHRRYHGGRKHRNPVKIPGGISVHTRSLNATNRRHYGHWEGGAPPASVRET